MADEQDINRAIADQGRAAKARAAREQLILARDATKAGARGDDARQELAKQQADKNALRVAINSPHSASVHDNQIALTIKSYDSIQQQQQTAIIYNAFSLYDAGITAGVSYLGIDNGDVRDASAIGGGTWLPSGMTLGAIRGSVHAFKIAVAGTGRAWLVGSVDDAGDGTTTGLITALGINVGDPMPDNALGTFYLPLGSYTVNMDGTIAISTGQQGIGSQTFIFCGGFYVCQPI